MLCGLDPSKKNILNKSIKIILKEKEHPIIDCLVQIEISEFTLNKGLVKIWHCLCSMNTFASTVVRWCPCLENEFG